MLTEEQRTEYAAWLAAYQRANLPTFCALCDIACVRPEHREAMGWLHAPDGQCNPGGAVCARHAASVVADFAAKLGEHWTVVPLVEHWACRAVGIPCVSTAGERAGVVLG